MRTCLEPSRVAQFSAEMDRYMLGVLGICETRWCGYNKMRLASGHVLLQAGSDKTGANGVAIILNPKTARSLLEWRGYSDRIVTDRLKFNR